MTGPIVPREWLAARHPVPPPALSARLIAALGADGLAPTTDLGNTLLGAGEALLSALLRDGRTDRQTALDLLAADAFVTYAFEAESDDPSRISERAQQAMTRISLLAQGNVTQTAP